MNHPTKPLAGARASAGTPVTDSRRAPTQFPFRTLTSDAGV